jgi:hypothetical protein
MAYELERRRRVTEPHPPPQEIANPKCDKAPGCGPWSPPKVDNPDYKGKWLCGNQPVRRGMPRRAVRNEHHHAIEQASRRWRERAVKF